MAMASKPSKNVAIPIMNRALRCHVDIGIRSMRATTSPTVPLPVEVSVFIVSIPQAKASRPDAVARSAGPVLLFQI